MGECCGAVVLVVGEGQAGGLVGGVGDDLDGVGVEVAVGDGGGGGVEDRGDVVFGLDVGGDGGGAGDDGFLDVALEDLAAGGGGRLRR